jgi:hypothetical protein
MPAIITLLDTHHGILCQPDKKMILIGMQPCIMAISSEMPMQLQRVFYPKQPQQHLCLSLLYQQQHRLFQQSDSVVIDLTLGHLMEADAYCERLFGELGTETPSKALGVLDQEMMIDLWKNLPQKPKADPPETTTKERNDEKHPQETVNS